MKKSIKKYLILALVFATLVVTFACVASAVNEKYYCGTCKAQISPIRTYKNPTCEAEGYTEVKCATCGFVFSRENYKPAKGHAMNNGSYVEVINEEKVRTHYEKVTVCTRGCGYEVSDGKKYYKYDLINPCGKVVAYDEDYKIADIPTKYEETLVATVYKEAGDVIDENDASAVHPGDKAHGAYYFKGWAPEVNQKATEDIEDYIVPESPAADNKLYATFLGLDNIQYTVNLYSDSGYLIKTIKVNHGDSEIGGIQFGDYEKWEKADDVNYRYTFTGWAWEKDKTLKIKNGTYFYGTTNDFGHINLVATFAEEAKEYILHYTYADGSPIYALDAYGNKIVDADGNFVEATDTVTNGMVGTDKLNPVYGLRLNRYVAADSKLYGFSDLSYNYVFTGKWLVKGNDNKILDLNQLNLTGLLDSDQNKYGYTVYPQYEPITRLYSIDMKISFFPPAGQAHSSLITVTITNVDGDFVDSVTLTEADIDGEGYYRYTAKLPYATRYYVSAISESYTGYVYDGKNNPQAPYTGFDSKTEKFTSLEIDMILNEKEPCDCICHGFLQPVVVKIYNIINSLFKKKIVCCDDMYATIGHKLNYKY